MLRLTYSLLILLFVNSCNVLNKAETDNPSDKAKNRHQQIIAQLQENASVIPEFKKLHPVRSMYNREAVIPPQCYTRTEKQYNPCYVCHQNAIPERENQMNDGALQQAYSFSDVGLTNHWKNLFEDRTKKARNISDKEILAWINTDNYSELAPRLRAEKVRGWIPDLANLQEASKAFDGEGFALDGSYWVAFNYKPMPSTFWPTNGSTGDVMIRLHEKLRQNKRGEYSRDIYKANLAIVEANIKGVDRIGSLPIDENIVEKDLNGDGRLSVINRISKVDQYVGQAEKFIVEKHIYPGNTEFLHTVRYIGIDDDGQIYNARRMKEVRYMRKEFYLPKLELAQNYREEGYEKEAGYLPGYFRRGAEGLDNDMGWYIKSYIEDRQGRLRFNTFEENFFCMGCHNSIGTTIDKVFSFARKVDGADGWQYINLRNMPDAPNKGEKQGEISTYLERAGGGSEFRNNDEMIKRWFLPDGSLNQEKINQADVYSLITPSKQRALMLNKAYRVIVDEQDYIYGRDATVSAPENVYKKIDNETSPTLPAKFTYQWNILLDWPES